MELNPYAKYLGNRDPIEVLTRTWPALAKLMNRMPEEQIRLAPPAGKWSAREIVAHLADCEIVFSFRLRQTLTEDNPTLQPFDQEKWAARYSTCDLESAMRLFEATRNWNLIMLDKLQESERLRPATHSERGTMTFWTIVETMAGHDINHLQQLERLAVSE